MSSSVNTRVTSTASKILQGSGKLSLNGTELGGYQAGLVMRWNQTQDWVTSDWHLAEIDGETKLVQVEFSTELEEATLENFARTYNINSSEISSDASSKVLNLKPSKTLLEYELTFEGMSSEGRNETRVVTLNKVVSMGQSQTTYYRGLKTVVPVTFKALLDVDTFGSIVDNIAQ